MDNISGLRITAKDSKGCPYEGEGKSFKVGFIGDLAFGVANDNTTDKEFLELCVPDLEAKIKQLEEDAVCFGKDVLFHRCTSGSIRPYHTGLCSNCMGKGENFNAFERAKELEAERDIALSKAELCRGEIRALAKEWVLSEQVLKNKDKDQVTLIAMLTRDRDYYKEKWESVTEWKGH